MNELFKESDKRADRRSERLELHIDNRLKELDQRNDIRFKSFDLRFEQFDQRLTQFERHIDRRIDDILTAMESIASANHKLHTRIEAIEKRLAPS